jgi:hypothetical protein
MPFGALIAMIREIAGRWSGHTDEYVGTGSFAGTQSGG